MPQGDPVEDIQRPADRVEDVTVAPLPSTGNMWVWASDGSR